MLAGNLHDFLKMARGCDIPIDLKRNQLAGSLHDFEIDQKLSYTDWPKEEPTCEISAAGTTRSCRSWHHVIDCRKDGNTLNPNDISISRHKLYEPAWGTRKVLYGFVQGSNPRLPKISPYFMLAAVIKPYTPCSEASNQSSSQSPCVLYLLI